MHQIKKISKPLSIFFEKLTYIGNYAFNECEKLEEISFFAELTKRTTNETNAGAKNLEYLGDYAFGKAARFGFVNHRAMMRETLEGTDPPIVFPESIKYFGASAFDGTPWCHDEIEEEKKTNKNGGIVYAGKWAYKATGSVSDVKIKDGTVGIVGNAFRDSNITSVTIAPDVKIIGSSAFYNCSNLKKVFFMPSTPPECGYLSFYNKTIPEDCKFYVNGRRYEGYAPLSDFDQDNNIVYLGKVICHEGTGIRSSNSAHSLYGQKYYEEGSSLEASESCQNFIVMTDDNEFVEGIHVGDNRTFKMPAGDTNLKIYNPDDYFGTPSEDGVYPISTPLQLGVLAHEVNNGNIRLASKRFELTDDINFSFRSRNNFTSIGNDSYAFSGSFDGQEHTISGIRLQSDSHDQGLFGQLAKNSLEPDNPSVKNVFVRDAKITGSHSVGGIVGNVGSEGCTVENCLAIDTTVKSTSGISGESNYIGAIAGKIYDSSALKNNYYSGCLANSDTVTLSGVGCGGDPAATDIEDDDGAIPMFSVSTDDYVQIEDDPDTEEDNPIQTIGKSKYYPEGTHIQLSHSIRERYEFGDYEVMDAEGNDITDSVMNGSELTVPNNNVTVSIKWENEFYVIVENGSNSGPQLAGDQVWITAYTAPAGMEFDKWTTGDGVIFSDANAETTSFIMPRYAVTVTANYKAAKTAPVITEAPKAKEGLVYNRQPQELVTAGEATGGIIQYALGNADGPTGSYTTSVPIATNAGSYYVWYRVVDDENYNDTEDGELINAEIKRAEWLGDCETTISRNCLNVPGAQNSIVLSGCLPADCGKISWKDVASEGIVFDADGRPAIIEDALTYKLGAGNTGERGKITVTAEVQNYGTQESGTLFTITIDIYFRAVRICEESGGEYKLLDPEEKRVTVGTSFTLGVTTADGEEIGGDKIIWASDNPDIAGITQDGKVTARNVGKTLVRAMLESDTKALAECEVIVTDPVAQISLNRAQYSFGTNEKVDLTASVLPLAASQEIVWSTSNASVVALCDNEGNVLDGTPSETDNNNVIYHTNAHTVTAKARGAGKATITAVATDGSGKKASCSFEVGDPVPETKTFKAGIKGKKGISIPDKPSLAIGKTLQMAVDWCGPVPKNSGVIWKTYSSKALFVESSDIASISSKGVLTGKKEGVVWVAATSAADPEKQSVPIKIEVYVPVRSVSLNMTSGTVSTGDNWLELKVNITSAVSGQSATGEKLGIKPTVKWSRDDIYAEYLNVNSETGVVTGNKAGKNIPVTATVTAYNNYKKTLTCKVTVKASNPLKGVKISKSKLTLGAGNKARLSASLDPVNPDGKKGIEWKSLDESVASVDKNGNVTALKEGKATIIATAIGTVKGKDGKPVNPKAYCKVTVKPSVTGVEITNGTDITGDENRGLAVGATYKLKTKITPKKPFSTALSWTSSNTSVATVSSKGVVTAKAPGEVTITAMSSDNKAQGVAPSDHVTIKIFMPVKSVKLESTSLTVGTKEGANYGKVRIASLEPANASYPSIKWTVDKKNKIVKLSAISPDGTAEGASYEAEAGGSVTTRRGEILAVMGVKPGVTKLTGVTLDGSKKKVTCKVTVRGEVTGIELKTSKGKNGFNNVTPEPAINPDGGGADPIGENEDAVKYIGKMKVGKSMTLTPLIEINKVKSSEKAYKTYKKYTDTSLSYRSSDPSVATVNERGKVNAEKRGTATIYVISADGRHSAKLTITVEL